MAILTRDAIFDEIKKGKIKIEPFDRSQIGPASIDLTLDNKFRFYKQRCSRVALNDIDIRKITELVKTDCFELLPGQAILGITKEKITLPENMCGWLEGRSRYARVGLQIHTTASFVQPGISNKQVLEMSNISPFVLEIRPGTKICQLILTRTEGKAEYKGKFSKQDNL
ncbi:dCTP deaminase [Candidatus Woesearchaeota archaeon]|nr:dCTP deaminase [Candidatus Woesearchaeota archaeon]